MFLFKFQLYFSPAIITISASFLFNLLLIPFGFTIRSVLNLLTVPGELIKIAKGIPILEENHALEHTINVTEERYGAATFIWSGD